MYKYIDMYDIVICVGPNDYEIVKESIVYTIKNIKGFRHIYLITPEPEKIILNNDFIKIINENIFPFDKESLYSIRGKSERHGWYLQQLLKLYAGTVITGILDNYLVIDSDTFFLKPITFITDNKFLLSLGYEYHIPYFIHMKTLHPSLKKVIKYSGIAHHMIFNKNIVLELFKLIENNHNNKGQFWELFIKCTEPNEYAKSGASEYEIYFNYLLLNHVDKIMLRRLNWKNLNNLSQINQDFDFVSIHHYMRR
jgi:hypothetical protein